MWVTTLPVIILAHFWTSPSNRPCAFCLVEKMCISSGIDHDNFIDGFFEATQEVMGKVSSSVLFGLLVLPCFQKYLSTNYWDKTIIKKTARFSVFCGGN